MKLDEVHRQLLLVLFAAEQTLEEQYRAVLRDRRVPPPVTGWRWMRYHTHEGQDTPLKRAIRHAGLFSEVTPALWEALALRKLIEVRYLSIDGETIAEVQITTKGRQLARKYTGSPSPQRPPIKVLSERQWQALVRLWQVGEEGIDGEELIYGPQGFSWSVTLNRLFRYRPEPLMEHFKRRPGADGFAYRISEAGRQFCYEQLHTYRSLYPNVLAPEHIGEKV